MKIALLCTNEQHPIMPHLQHWKVQIEQSSHQVTICSKKAELDTGDILFLISCSEKIGVREHKRFKHVLVLHASDLPRGRGWSPHIWEILNGSESITLSLIEAADKIDTGDVWKKIYIPVPKQFLWNEINDALFQGELELMRWAIDNCTSVKPAAQDINETATYWSKRTTRDSRVDAEKSIREQFDLLRVCDPDRYPAYFEMYGIKYKLWVERYDEEK